jgi:primosomal protein N' (replication factor Y)
LFCDVALPVPLDRVFTYAIAVDGAAPQAGCRVLVPFRTEKMAGIVTRVHDEAPLPPIEAKPLLAVLDETPVVSPVLMELAAWIAGYYLCPLGEVLRTMLPLMAEVRRRVLYRIAESGRRALHEGAEAGSSRRSRRSPEEQDAEYAVLNYLENGEPARLSTLRSATGASAELLNGMVRKKWIARETEAEARDARRLVRFAVLAPESRLPKLNANQQALLAELAGAGGELPVAELRRVALPAAAREKAGEAGVAVTVPASTLGTLVRRGLVRLEERPATFHVSGLGRRQEHVLNSAQAAALAAIEAAVAAEAFQPLLLYGVTGSGKTAVYLAAMRAVLAQGKSTILLVPEIGLTPAMAAELHHAFGAEVALLHSQLTPEERAEQWHRVRQGAARVVVGTRSAVFAPVENLGLMLVDEEHDGSYKQEEMPRYHARDVAVMRAKLAGAAVVLGSATPSLESWQNAERGRYARVTMSERVGNRPLPEVELVDMRQEFQQTGEERLFARRLVEETEATLDRGEQAIILLNRRGYSFVAMCRACGEKLQCENCAISLTLHKAVLGETGDRALVGQRLECHYCGYKRTVPRRCPQCDSEHLYYLGAGSQQGEEKLSEIFPGARIGRMDRDTVRGRGDMERLLLRLHSGEINLLVGTQMIAKGHDIHGVTLVGVVGADYALGLPDFRAAERVFQLLTQVSGRAGRGALAGRVVVQTYHPVVHSAVFDEAAAWAETLGRWFAATPFDKVRVLGPATAPLSKVKRIYRFHLVVKAESRSALHAALRAMLDHAETAGVPRKNLIVDVDAVSLM